VVQVFGAGHLPIQIIFKIPLDISAIIDGSLISASKTGAAINQAFTQQVFCLSAQQ
jgi:hypothetical protein